MSTAATDALQTPQTPNTPDQTAAQTRLTGRPRSRAGIIARFAGWDFLRNVRMVEATFFIVVLPAALYLMFGALAEYGSQPAGHGNVTAYQMVSMGVYGAVMATSSMAGSAAVERQQGWGRQLGLTGLTGPGYVLGKVLVALAMSVLPIVVVYTVGFFTGAEMDSAATWFSSAGLTLIGALPFAFYGLAAALLFRSEAAVSAASGLLVVLAFFGNLFMPLTGTLLEVAKFTPLYGVASLARWPQLEGTIVAVQGEPQSDPLGLIVLNVVAWTLVFALICWVAARRTTRRG